MRQFKIWLASLICFSVLDFLCFTFVLGPFYRRELVEWARFNPDGSVHFSYLAGAVVYALMAAGFTAFVWPKIKNANFQSTIFNSAFFGLVLYGVYDFTNLAFAKNWPPSFAAVDILWGIVACALTGLIIKSIIKS